MRKEVIIVQEKSSIINGRKSFLEQLFSPSILLVGERAKKSGTFFESFSDLLQHIKDMNVENCLAHKEFEMEWPEARFMLVEELETIPSLFCFIKNGKSGQKTDRKKEKKATHCLKITIKCLILHRDIPHSTITLKKFPDFVRTVSLKILNK